MESRRELSSNLQCQGLMFKTFEVHIELEFRSVGIEGGSNANLVPRVSSSSRYTKLRMAGRGGDPGNEVGSNAWREPTTNSTHLKRRVRVSNPSHKLKREEYCSLHCEKLLDVRNTAYSKQPD